MHHVRDYRSFGSSGLQLSSRHICAPCAVGAATVSLVLGGHAFLAAGIAHDRPFSSVVRSTGDRDLDVLCAEDEGNAALPLAPELQERQFRFPGDGIAHATKMMQPRRG